VIRGTVNAQNEPIVPLRVRGPLGAELEVAALVDTGLTASLALPPATIAALGLVYRTSLRGLLADGSPCEYALHEAELLWDGEYRPILVSAVGNQPLLGMRMLGDHELRVEARPGGAVEIRELP
jgi:predicted aspartyl protease